MPKFFIDSSQVKNDQIVLEGNDVNHIHRVMRYGINDEIIICDGQGIDYKCIIELIQDDKLIANILSAEPTNTEPKIQIYLYQSLPKSDKMEYIIQKSVELGVYKIIPVSTNRTIVKLSDDKKANKRLERWNKISESAAKQSGRGNIPVVSEAISFKQAINQASGHDLSIIPYEKEKNLSLRNVLKNSTYGSIGIFIGPEGGFAEEEILLARQNQVIPITLGSRILRTETVSSAVISILMYESGEI